MKKTVLPLFPHSPFVARVVFCSLIAAFTPSAVRAQSFPLPESVTDCAKAVTLSGQVAGKLELREFVKYQTRVLELCKGQFGDTHPETTKVMNELAITYGELGQYDKVLILREQILNRRRAQLGEDHPVTLSGMNLLAIAYSNLAQYDKALILREQTLKLRRTKLGEDHPDTLNSMKYLADSYSELGQYQKALELREQTLRLSRFRQGEDHPDTFRSMKSLASTYSDLGRPEMALMLAEQTLKLTRAKQGDDHFDTLSAMSQLAACYSDLGQDDKALALDEVVLRRRRASLGEDHPDTLNAIHNLSITYSLLGHHDKALVLKEMNLKLRRARLGVDHPDTLSTMSSLAGTYIALGQHDKGLALYEQTLALSRIKRGETHPSTTLLMFNLARAYGKLGQFDKKLYLNKQTLKLWQAIFGEGHVNILVVKSRLAESYRELNQSEDALALIPEIVTGVEKLRSLPGLSTEQRQSVFSDWSDSYQNYANWYASAKRLSEGFNIGDLSKARTLTESIKAQAALRSLPVAEQQKLQASDARAQQLQTQIDKLNAQNTRDSSAVLALQKQLDTHNSSHQQLVAELNSRYPKYAQLTNLKPATAAQGKQLLAQGDLFISYLIHTKGDAQAFLLDASGEPRWVDLGKINNHAQTVAASRELIAPSTRDSGQGRLVALKDGGYQWLQPGQATPKDATAAASNPNDARQQLNRYWHDKLIKPIQSLAGNSPRWIISPDKDLALLPFDTLPDSISASGEPGKTLAQTRNLTLVQSFAVYALLKQRESDYAQLQRPKELFAMGNAIYSDGWAENRGLSRGSGERRYTQRNAKLISSESDITSNPISNGNSTPGSNSNGTPLKPAAEQFNIDQLEWKNLPGTAREVKAVSAVFNTNASTSTKGSGSSGGADSYLGKDASEGKLQQLNESGKLKDYRYLLFSAHGYLAQTPALSSLVLSLQGNPPGIDGYVTASEWPLYDVKSDLTVLSACDTGVGKTQAGESVMGLPYALFVAGNKNTLLSLWPVDDDATAEFMKRFFTKLKAGSKQPDALTETKREFMLHPKWSAPRYWAAFVLYGV